jgi:hypothetical protein
MWLWAGDAVYLGGDQPASLEEAFRAQLRQEGYRQLLAQDIIVGTTLLSDAIVDILCRM